jgi:Protein of unknown function (DUF3052)
MAGYSGTPLPEKLGIKETSRVRIVGAPAAFAEGLGVKTAARGEADVIVLFTRSASELTKAFAKARKDLHKDGGLWVAWPKKASKVVTDLTETFVREHGLSEGLVDNKVCAIDETWSGLRFVVRLADR